MAALLLPTYALFEDEAGSVHRGVLSDGQVVAIK